MTNHKRIEVTRAQAAALRDRLNEALAELKSRKRDLHTSVVFTDALNDEVFMAIRPDGPSEEERERDRILTWELEMMDSD